MLNLTPQPSRSPFRERRLLPPVSFRAARLRPLRRPRLLASLLLFALLFQTACGTIIYPERRGQTRGQIDPAVVVMNGLLLILFIVPGIVAFAVDFATGAIYLPPGGGSGEGTIIHLDPDDMTPERIAEAIYQETGMRITLNEEDLRMHEVGSVAEVQAAVEAAGRTR